MRRWRSTMAPVLLLVTAGVAEGQEVRLGVHGGRLSDDFGSVERGVGISSELSLGGRTAALWLAAQGTFLEGAGVSGGASAATDAVLWSGRWLSLALVGNGSVSASDAGYRSATAGVSPRLRVGGFAFSGEVGPVVAWGGARYAAEGGDDGLLGLPRRVPGGEFDWRQAYGAAGVLRGAASGVRGRLEGRRLRLDEATQWSDLSASVGVDVGPADLNLRIGQRSGTGGERWAAAGVRVALSSGIDLMGEVGRQASDPVSGRTAAGFAMVGASVRLGHGTLSGSALPAGNVPAGRTRLALRAEPGARVELIGDWTGWQAVAVEETEPGRYVADVELAPGVHRFGFLVDGRWTVPDGYPTEPDEYGGRRAVLRVSAAN